MEPPGDDQMQSRVTKLSKTVTSEIDQMLFKLLKKDDSVKLPHNVNFVFHLDKKKRTVKMSAQEIVAAVDNEQFAKMFNRPVKRIKQEGKPEINLFATKPDVFISLLR